MIDTIKASDVTELQVLITNALLEIDPESVPSSTEILKGITAVLENNIGLFFRVHRVDGKVIGFLAGHVGQGFMVSDVHAHIVLAYTLPEYRDNGYTGQLYLAFEEWAITRGAHRIVVVSRFAHDDLSEDFLDGVGASISGSLLTKTL